MQESLIFYFTTWTDHSHIAIQTDAGKCSSDGSLSTTTVLPEILSSLSLVQVLPSFSECSVEGENKRLLCTKPLLLSGG